MFSDKKITDEDIQKLLDGSKNHKTRFATIWLSDVDVNTDEVIGLELVNDILCLTVAKYIESANDRRYEIISQFAVDKEAFQSALDCLDIVES